MERYELKKSTLEVTYKNRQDIKEGCTFPNDSEPERLKTFNNESDALEALKTYESYVSKTGGTTGTLYTVTEYYIEGIMCNEEGEYLECIGTWFAHGLEDFTA